MGGLKAIAIIGHIDCGMAKLTTQKEKFIAGLAENSGWDECLAEEYFAYLTPVFEIGNEIDFVLSETKRLRQRYPGILVVLMLYRVEDNLLYIVDE